jgi:predicted transcriptional regulator
MERSSIATEISFHMFRNGTVYAEKEVRIFSYGNRHNNGAAMNGQNRRVIDRLAETELPSLSEIHNVFTSSSLVIQEGT